MEHETTTTMFTMLYKAFSCSKVKQRNGTRNHNHNVYNALQYVFVFPSETDLLFFRSKTRFESYFAVHIAPVEPGASDMTFKTYSKDILPARAGITYTGQMRVISGIYGGRVLRSPSDNRTRPTSDRLRETLFNVLAPRIDAETRFLDLCAGTGSIGIEALSRGAAFATFVDRSKKACALIEENLDKLGVPESNTSILALDADNFTGREHANGWDVAYFDPPYDSDYAPVMHEFGYNKTLLNENGLLIAEHHSKKNVPDETGPLRRWRIIKQGETSLSFYERG